MGFQRAEVGLSSVGEHGVELLDVIQGLAVNHRMRPTGVVANAAADAGPAGRGGVWSVHQATGHELPVELVQDDAGLDPDPMLFLINLQHLVQVFAEVHHNGMVHSLPGQAGAPGPG